MPATHVATADIEIFGSLFLLKNRVLRQALQAYKQQRLDNLSSAFFNFRLIVAC
jgi:hypothetical protein